MGLLLTAEMAPWDVDDPQLAAGFLLHDVGKLALPAAIVDKPGPLTASERAEMHRHPQQGWRMLNEIEYGGRTRDVVLFHHERWDGSGYPLGLAGESIPLWARIFAVADAMDAMVGDRPYRAAMTPRDAYDELRAGAGGQFDPSCVDAFLGLSSESVAGYEATAARSVASKSVRGIGPTHGDVLPALR
jgi:ribonuclease P protein subunit RPR2